MNCCSNKFFICLFTLVLLNINASILIVILSRIPAENRVHCRPIYNQIRIDSDVDNDISMDSTDDDSSDNDDDDNRVSMVRYLHIAEVPDEYTIGIFVFGPNERIPLHDHPEMCVLSRVLYGDLQRLSLDLDRKGRSPNDENFDANIMDMDEDVEDSKMQSAAEDDVNNTSISSIRNFLEKQNQPESSTNHNSSSSFLASLSRSANWFFNGSSSSGITMESETEHQPHYPEGTKLAYRNAIDRLEAPNVASLYPYEGNLHEFVAGPYGAAVLDVLLPPYDDEHRRDCTFYHIRDIPAPSPTPSKRRGRRNNARFKGKTTTTPINTTNTPTAASKSTSQREPCLIVPTGQPENFHCKSGPTNNKVHLCEKRKRA